MTAEDGHGLLSVIVDLIGLIENTPAGDSRDIIIKAAFGLEMVLHNEIIIAINGAVNKV